MGSTPFQFVIIVFVLKMLKEPLVIPDLTLYDVNATIYVSMFCASDTGWSLTFPAGTSSWIMAFTIHRALSLKGTRINTFGRTKP